ncbi:L-ascorbate metabolism protein UlaG (beta-lactamase superfamily) [Hoeflea marina]|uniref:L-ascorbate metabolism protein UlaG (Beta-lactamase superfamily) n=1 Tax=Hoeflea marina TaxID=274592 RepID=A0A317PC61_9HYPH|nr:MBL fold metallo-hydrolase [Hoeflea marina]PWV95483.1 L-ascorbate metabolism protein UlaG (beta-lactamase superfamily) [Hoeflea marina]
MPILALVAVLLAALSVPALAEDAARPFSQCMAVAEALPQATYVNLAPDALPVAGGNPGEVEIRFAAHATYVITTPAGVTIATDYNGYAGPVEVPRVVTMNKAHGSHFTRSPDPRIGHVLPGWRDDGMPAEHHLVVEDVYVRNVTTDIRNFGGMEPDGNSIFIFEVADLCIGHLGHLHHPLEDRHYAKIGRLDIVMVPVDGGLTLSHGAMTAIARRLQSSILLPMHRRGAAISGFITMMGDSFATDYVNDEAVTVSARSLPRRPTIMVLKGI